MRRRHSLGTLLSLGVLLAGACATAPTGQSGPPLPFPSALQGPGKAELDQNTMRRLESSELQLRQGDLPGARSTLNSGASSPQARLLLLQLRILEGANPEAVFTELRHETELSPSYASLWCTLSYQAEKTRHRRDAIEAASRCSELWPRGPEAGREQELRQEWIIEALQRARELLAAGRVNLELLDGILRLEPENREALLLKAESLLKLGKSHEAEAALALLQDDPEAVMMRARLAMKTHRWQEAMDLLNSLPESLPGRKENLRKAHILWRLSILPAYVQDAADSSSLSREECAVLFVALAPNLESLPGAQIPLMTDIIDLPSQRSILATVRLGIFSPDTVSHLFEPKRRLSPAELRTAIDAICHLLSYQTPLWCPSDELGGGSCVELKTPISGPNLVQIMLNLENLSR